MNEEFWVDITALRDQQHLIQEKHRYAQRLMDLLHQMSSIVSPELQDDCHRLMVVMDGFLHYYHEQENVLEEMSNRYDAANHLVNMQLEEAVHLLDTLF